jgi:mono/diheme cytochrome c family protein
LLVCASLAAQSRTPPDYDVEYLGPPLADPVLQYSKETYVQFGCAYCHGLNLTPRGEAADLRSSVIVGRDQNANLIGPLLRAGIPQTPKLSPMPQFSDLSDQQIGAIARWIHYARQRARFEALTEGPSTIGNAAAGRRQFDANCATCHSTTGDLTGIGKKYDAAALRAQLLQPKALARDSSFRMDRLRDARTALARERHNFFLENASAADTANLVALLQGPD